MNSMHVYAARCSIDTTPCIVQHLVKLNNTQSVTHHTRSTTHLHTLTTVTYSCITTHIGACGTPMSNHKPTHNRPHHPITNTSTVPGPPNPTQQKNTPTPPTPHPHRPESQKSHPHTDRNRKNPTPTPTGIAKIPKIRKSP